ncbi:DUF2516 family protein [Aeromicrobium sp. SMF47]|uniref:DUF2516 family protein n=1 Tax=Aeromicrobium yanjiei TaxID=2662028 RepID=A0A5Q2MH62_9ACTN|nr:MULTISPECIES: DUF2516 family protein [Aeromicrobium]MRJ75169.1 DUF2516 family protein [Aeromicrobium yanjiei]MRK02774.1 DUF2516 family protein [Aeromicrobium sp. S22]QGG40376.1 DUF2516 family protein [Aeromicrobium yanjiei]
MFELQGGLLIVLSLLLFAAKGFALVDCVARQSSQFTYLETLPKRSWLIILSVSLVAHLIWWDPLQIFNLIGTVGSLVYLAQVRGSAH